MLVPSFWFWILWENR